MKAFFKRASLCLFAVTVAMLVSGTGCASHDDDQNMSERPWNAPKSWETGIPQGMMQGR